MAKDPSNPWSTAKPRLDDTKPSRDEAPQRSPRPARESADSRPSAQDRPARRSEEKPKRTRDERPARDDKSRGERSERSDRTGEKRAPRKSDQAAPGRNFKDSAARKERAPFAEHPRHLEDFEETGERYPQADRSNEYKVYGVNACIAAAKRRKEDIIRGYFSQGIAGKFGETMRYLAQQKKAYRVVEDDELEKVTQSTHHGGVCFLMKKRQPTPLAVFLAKMEKETAVCLLALEAIGNPHNLGAILRSCANFGVPAVLVDNANSMQSGAAARVAEGGAEWVELVEYDTLPNLLEQLHQAGFSVLSTSSHHGRDLYRTELPLKTVIFFGEEAHGLKPDTLNASDLCIRIPGTSNVESLNVSASTGIILGEFWRQHKSGSRSAKIMPPKAAQPKGGRLKLKKPKGSA